MPIHQEAKVAFIHIPKCAGSSIEKRYDLRRKDRFFSADKHAYQFDNVTYAPQHLTPSYLSKIVPDWESYRSFCFIRHPYDKLVSEYFWLHEDGVFGAPHKPRWSERKFRKWLIEDASKKNMDHLLTQWSYAKECNHVFKLSEIDLVIPKIDAWFGHFPTTKLTHDKKNNRSKIARLMLGKKSKNLIYAIYREDFLHLPFER